MDFKDIISHFSSTGGINNFGSINFNDIHDNENVYVSDANQEKDNEKNEKNVRETSLVLTPKQQQAFSLAVERGYMTRNDDGTYQWHLKPVTLSYFLGRIFVGDYTKKDSCGTVIWRQGKKAFRASKFEKLFATTNIGVARRKGLNGKVPEEHEMIDSLLEEL